MFRGPSSLKSELEESSVQKPAACVSVYMAKIPSNEQQVGFLSYFAWLAVLPGANPATYLKSHSPFPIFHCRITSILTVIY